MNLLSIVLSSKELTYIKQGLQNDATAQIILAAYQITGQLY